MEGTQTQEKPKLHGLKDRRRYYSIGLHRGSYPGGCKLCGKPIDEGDLSIFIAFAGTLEPIGTICAECGRDIAASHQSILGQLEEYHID